MTLTIAQDHAYAGDDYWKWRAWIKGKPADLDRIEKVTWFLHPSFARSLVVSRHRSTGFRLKASGWGTFTLRAEAHFADGTVQLLSEPLRLSYPAEVTAPGERSGISRGHEIPPTSIPETGHEAAGRSIRKIFLSYASSDRRNAMTLRRTLETLGMSIVDDSAINAGEPFELAALDLLRGADATVAYLSGELPSAYVAQEINTSVKSGKPTLVVTGEGLGPIAGVSADIRVARLDLTDAASVAAEISGLEHLPEPVIIAFGPAETR